MKVRVGNGEIFDGATDVPIAIAFEPEDLEKLAADTEVYADFNSEDFTAREVSEWMDHRAELDSSRFRDHPPEARELSHVATRE